ncbi:MAG TPA: glycosyltransferase family 4 protein, partial [Vicinamibacterales bacterium]|nr:glycosyltransferase family 4 protein [Vicinamibacterales bacterium]
MSSRILLYARVNPADGGGVQSLVQGLARHLRARGHEVTKAWAFPAPPGSEDLTLPLRPVVLRGRLPAPRSTIWAAGALGRLTRLLFRLRPDVVNVHYVTGEAVYFALLKPLFRYRLVLSVHGSDVLRTQAPDAPLLPYVLPAADALTAVSPLTVAALKEYPDVNPARIREIPNGVDYGFWSAGSDVRPGNRAPVVVSVARLDRVKGHDVLLHAFALVRARVPAARLVIVGEGGQRSALETLARLLGIAPAVEFTGQLDAEGVRERLRTARVFALSSRSEGLPIALLEAMAAGATCVATNVGGTCEVLTPGTGLLVPSEDPAALAEAIVRLLVEDHSAARLILEARRRAARFPVAVTFA